MFRKPPAGGLGLTGILIVGGVLYYTGYGAILLDKLQRFDQSCRGTLAGAGMAVSDPVCSGVSYGTEAITVAADSVGNVLHGIDDSFKGLFGKKASGFEGIEAFGASFKAAVSGLSSSSDRLSQMVMRGPQPYQPVDASQRFQHAIDSFSIGQRYMAQQGGVTRAVPWLMQGARQPDGYGVLSQLSLGDLYRNGAQGVPADPIQSQLYYSQAMNSLALLNQNDSPQAQLLLQTLPASPQVLQQQLLQVVGQLKNQKVR